MSMGDIGGMVTGAAQAGVGAMQGMGEMFMQFLNWIRTEDIGKELKSTGKDAAGNFDTKFGSQMDTSEQRLNSLIGMGKESFDKSSEYLRKGKDEAISQYSGLPGYAQSMGTALTNKVDKQVGRSTKQAQENVDTTMATGLESLMRLRNEGTKMLSNIQTQGSDILSKIRSSGSEVAGESVGGLRVASKRSAQEYEAKARLSGIATDEDIALQKRSIEEGTNREVSGVWNKAMTDISDKVAVISSKNLETYTGYAANLQNILGQNEANFTASVLRAREGVTGAMMDGARIKAEVGMGIMNTVTGVMEFASKGIADVIGRESEMQAANEQNRNTYNVGVQQALVGLDQVRVQGLQYSTDTWLNSVYQSAGVRAGFSLVFPNISASMAGGFNTMASAFNQMSQPGAPGQKTGVSATAFGFGGGYSCVDANALVETLIGFEPITDLHLGSYVLGSDSKYHRIIGLDIGLVPIEDQDSYMCIMGTIYSTDGSPIPFGICVTKDHPIGGLPAKSIGIGDQLGGPYGLIQVTGVALVPYLMGADLELEDCAGYAVNGLFVDSVISTYPLEYRNELRSIAKAKGYAPAHTA